MSLEGKLASLQVEADFLQQQLDPAYASEEAAYYLTGFCNELEHMYENYRFARKALRRKEEGQANRYIGDFALSTKNAIDNINLYMQEVYGRTDATLRNTKCNLSEAPGPDRFHNMHDFYRQRHSFRGDENTLVYVRNQRAHGDTHALLSDAGDHLEFVPQCGVNDPEEWLEQEMNHYLDVQRDILETLSADTTRYVQGERGSVPMRRMRNSLSWYGSSVRTTAAAAVFVVGLTVGIGAGVYLGQPDAPSSPPAHVIEMEERGTDHAVKDRKIP